MANKREIYFKYLDGSSKYDYCPYCVRKCEEEGQNYKERLKPLKYVKTADPIKRSDGTYWDFIDFHYECLRCGAINITVKTFEIFYTCRYDGTKINEPPKEPGLVWSKEKERLVPAKWNHQLEKWEEIIDKAV